MALSSHQAPVGGRAHSPQKNSNKYDRGVWNPFNPDLAVSERVQSDLILHYISKMAGYSEH